MSCKTHVLRPWQYNAEQLQMLTEAVEKQKREYGKYMHSYVQRLGFSSKIS